MIVDVHMLAFMDGQIRPVEIEDRYLSDDMKLHRVLELAFHYGQNDFCHNAAITQTFCSVSMGDVIEYPKDTYHLVKAMGFEPLTVEQFHEYARLSLKQRISRYMKV